MNGDSESTPQEMTTLLTRVDMGITGLAKDLDKGLEILALKIQAGDDATLLKMETVREQTNRAHSRIDALESRISANFRIAVTGLLLPIAAALALAILVPR